MDNFTTTIPTTTLLQDAQECARAMVMRWARAVFREMSVRVLQRRCLVPTINNNNISTPITLTVSQEDLAACEQACQRLGHLWCHRLRDDAGKSHVEGWIREVLEAGRFWEADDEVVLGVGVGMPLLEEEKVAQGRQAEEDAVAGKTISTLPVADTVLLPMTRIQQLGEEYMVASSSSSSSERPPATTEHYWVRVLDELGQRGQTHWPLDWSLVEQAAARNTKRLHLLETPRRPSRNNNNGQGAAKQLEVVPKSLVVTAADQRDDEQLVYETDALLQSAHRTTRDMMRRLKERKRQADAVSIEESSSSNNNKRLRRQQEMLLEVEQARPPSHVGRHERWPWQEVVAELSPSTREELERTMLHSDHHGRQEEDDVVVQHVLVGALKRVGRQQLLSLQEEEEEEWTDDKQRRRCERKAMKERLGPHDVLKDDRDAERSSTYSKVMRTSHHQGQEQQFLELDMGECLLEVGGDEDGREPMLCAFSSVELTLCDHDDDDMQVEILRGA